MLTTRLHNTLSVFSDTDMRINFNTQNKEEHTSFVLKKFSTLVLLLLLACLISRLVCYRSHA